MTIRRAEVRLLDPPDQQQGREQQQNKRRIDVTGIKKDVPHRPMPGGGDEGDHRQRNPARDCPRTQPEDEQHRDCKS